MPLVLGLRKNQDFYAAGKRFVVELVNGPRTFRLRRDDGRQFEIDDSRAVRIEEDVYASAGHPHRPEMIAVALEAPHHIPIVRGQLKKQPNL